MKLTLHADDSATDHLHPGKRVKIEATVRGIYMTPIYSPEGEFLLYETHAELRLDLIDHLEEHTP